MVASRIAMTTISTPTDVPTTERIMSAKMRVGKAMITSTKRLRPWSTHPRRVAARKPQEMPMAKERMVVTRAMEIVLRAP